MNVSKRHWLTASERWLLVGSGLGTVATLLGQNAALASAPINCPWQRVGLLNRHKTGNSPQKIPRQYSLRISGRQAGMIKDLSRQVTALPSPEALNHFQRSVMKRNNRNFLRLTQEIKAVREELHESLEAMPAPDLSSIDGDIAQLKDQYAHAAAAIEHLNTSTQRLITLPRMEAAEQKAHPG